MVNWLYWESLTFLIISLSLSLVSIAYMIGTGFHLPKLQGWAKEELYQAIGSALLAILIIALASTLETAVTSVYGANPFQVATGYINTLVVFLSGWFASIVATDTILAMFQSLALKAMPSQTGFNINLFTGLSPVTAMLSLGMEALLGGMGLMIGQSALISFIEGPLSIILPIGLALRAFPYSRPAGGAMIAVFLGFYVFYPFLWMFDNAIFWDSGVLLSTLGGGGRNAGAAGGQAVDSIRNLLGIGTSCTDDPLGCTTNRPDFGGNMMLALIYEIAYPVLYTLFIFVAFLPLFNLIVVLVLVNELAKLLGEEIDIGGLSGLI